ncbi:MAG: 50S ribosomal protein L9 [Gemmatimonadetes bacterium]|nr:50S ribosomal protein L9 [Gemmatimonadota bacterium]
MEVILREDVKGLGKAGALVKVKPGYGRNFLLPRGLAFEATEGNKKRIEHEQRARLTKHSAEKSEAADLAAKLGAAHLTLKAKAGEGDKLFGSITTGDLADALAKIGFAIDKRKIELEHPLKQLGVHAVAVRLHAEVRAEFKVTVESE